MRWTTRAFLLRLMAQNEFGYGVYQFLQRQIGGVNKPSFWKKRWVRQVLLAQQLKAHGAPIDGQTLFEVGSGWVPTVPLGFWFCGAAQVHSYDTNPHFIPSVLSAQLRWLVSNKQFVLDTWGGFSSTEYLTECLQLVEIHVNAPLDFLREAGIELHSPADASRTRLADGSVDIHYSNNVLEHIAEPVIEALLVEAARVLRPTGLAIHHIDPSDHFSHSDSKISSVNFLRFSSEEWHRIAGNHLAYHNRLREPDYEEIFSESPLNIRARAHRTNARALNELEQWRSGAFLGRIHERYSAMTPLQLATMPLEYVCELGQ